MQREVNFFNIPFIMMYFSKTLPLFFLNEKRSQNSQNEKSQCCIDDLKIERKVSVHETIFLHLEKEKYHKE